jgi:hypothetical protein
MMRLQAIALVAVLGLVGCSAVKEKVGDLEKEALVQSITDSVDKKLEQRGLSLATLKSAVDVNGAGKIDPKQATAETVSMAKELALAETKKLLDDKAKEFEANHITRNEFGQERESLWVKIGMGLFGLISTYLGKQIVSGRQEAKKHANYHARMAVLEALVGKKALGDDEDDGTPPPRPVVLPPAA